MRSNGLLKWLMIPMALAVLFVAIRLFSGHSGPAPESRATAQLTPEEMKALGIEGDSPRDTVATLVAQVKQLRNELQTALNDNTNAKAENDRLRARESTIDQRVQGAIDGERSHLREEQDRVTSDRKQTQGLLQDLQKRLDGLTGKTGQTDLPVGLGLEDGDGKAFTATHWVEPEDGRSDDKKGGNSPRTPGFPTSFGPAQTTLTGPADDAATAGTSGKKPGIPVYTVPVNATLMGSIAMTALIGRVPIDGTVNDPYPFKVLIGPDNLTANGIDLPDVAGAVVSGTASGDWTLSCVRGQIRSVTFVFQDGTIRTIPEDSGNGNAGNGSSNANTNTGQNGNSTAIQGGLGWISDPYGIPCVSGERHSNAEQYLGSQLLITAAGAGAASLIPKGNNDYSFLTNGGSGSTIGTVGITGNQAMGRILAGGVQEMSQWVDKLYGQAFAAIYVPPGARVAVHLDRPLNIDYDPKGRRVNHRLGEAHASDLD